MTYFGIVTEIKDIRKHNNADRLMITTIFGNPVVVGTDTQIGDVVVYFPSDGQLSDEFCAKNNLYRHAYLNSDKSKSGYFEDNRRVRIQKFRGEVSDGFVVPLKDFDYTGQTKKLTVGVQFDSLGNHLICNKYVNEKTANAMKNKSVRTARKYSYPMFKEHFETEQLRFFIDSIPDNSRITVTEKLHGTSHRITNTIELQKETWLDKLAGLLGYSRKVWRVVDGTRRTVLSEEMEDKYYKDDFRQKVHNKLKDVLFKGEIVYLEIVGYTSTGTIMGTHNVEKLKDLDLLKKYGKTITYSYGNPVGECDFYVYRITMCNEDGHEIEYSWDQVKRRCNELGIKHVPEIGVWYQDKSNRLDLYLAEQWAKGDSTLDYTHIREGVCFRVENEYGTKIYKHKSVEFKIMEDILKTDDVVDMEESS